MQVAVIEDSTMVSKFYQSYLQGSEYQARFYTSAPESIEQMCAHPWDIIICRAFPHFQDAPAIVTRIKSDPKYQKVLFIVSTSSEGHTVAGGWDITMVGGILRLPFDQPSLLKVLDQVKGRIIAAARAVPLAVVVDDSQVARQVLKREMQALGFEVQTAVDGQKGLELIRQVMPDIVLTDIEMPVMTGLELCNAVANDPIINQVPIIVISSITTDAQIRSGFGSGVINFLRKPVNFSELALSVGALLGNLAVTFQGTALIVDDDPKSASIIRKELIKAGVQANVGHTAAELEAFLAVCRPDLIILDVVLPDGRGPELARKIRSREELNATPIVVLADDTERDLMIECLNSKADDFLIKPFTQEEFKARIESHLRAKRLHNELMQRNRILESLAYQDGLTGLLNRRYLDEGLQREMAAARTQNTSLGFLLIDLDHFKKVNDTYGHQTGDDVLRGVAAEIQNTVREMGMACRYGGEEMCVVLPGASLLKATEVAERLRVACDKRRFTDHNIRQTLSIGVSAFPEPSSADSLIRDADASVYQAKSGGRNRVAVAGQSG